MGPAGGAGTDDVPTGVHPQRSWSRRGPFTRSPVLPQRLSDNRAVDEGDTCSSTQAAARWLRLICARRILAAVSFSLRSEMRCSGSPDQYSCGGRYRSPAWSRFRL